MVAGGGFEPENFGLCDLTHVSMSVRAARAGLTPSSQGSSGRRQFHLHWGKALRRISTEKHSDVFLYEPGGLIGSRDHACPKAQGRLGKRVHRIVRMHQGSPYIFKDAGYRRASNGGGTRFPRGLTPFRATGFTRITIKWRLLRVSWIPTSCCA